LACIAGMAVKATAAAPNAKNVLVIVVLLMDYPEITTCPRRRLLRYRVLIPRFIVPAIAPAATRKGKGPSRLGRSRSPMRLPRLTHLA